MTNLKTNLMTKIILKIVLFSILLLSNLMVAQEFRGQAIYESKDKMNDFKISSPDMTEEMKKKMEERMIKALEKTYVLDFNKFESIYREEVKLEAPAPTNGMSFKTVSSGDGKKYKNIKEKIEISEEEFFGKEFLVQDSLPKWDWKLDGETKKIGNYTCYKATILIAVSEEDKNEYEKIKNKKGDEKTQFITVIEPKDKTITAWYTPEIAISQGPEKYWGLPGLILEVNDGKKIILCSKIILNPKEKIEIKKPNKGKKVNQKEYEETVEKQLESMKDSNGVIKINFGG
jgi:GLPGLI family protein